jgi:hypothetical protein
MKKPYEKPEIIYQGVIETRAASCSKNDEICRQTTGGPLWS